MTFSVLFVCTGNICRSPMAEIIFRNSLDDDVDATVASAGVRAVVDDLIDGPTAAALSQLGLDGSQHRARQFHGDLALHADLILTATRAHRDEVLRQAPAAFRRTFTIKEFSRIACLLPHDDDPQVIVSGAARGRGGSGVLDDIADPFGASAIRAQTIADDLVATTGVVVTALGFNKRLVIARRPIWSER